MPQPAAQRFRYSLRSPFGPACGCYSASLRFGLLNGEVGASVRSRIEKAKSVLRCLLPLVVWSSRWTSFALSTLQMAATGWMATPWKTAKRFPPFGTHALLLPFALLAQTVQATRSPIPRCRARCQGVGGAGQAAPRAACPGAELCRGRRTPVTRGRSCTATFLISKRQDLTPDVA